MSSQEYRRSAPQLYGVDVKLHFFTNKNKWKAGAIPNFLMLCMHIAKKFLEHPGKLQLERVDKLGMDSLYENVEA